MVYYGSYYGYGYGNMRNYQAQNNPMMQQQVQSMYSQPAIQSTPSVQGMPPSGTTLPYPPQQGMPTTPQVPGVLPAEQSYIENILRLNLGKIATIYMTFEGNREWNAKVFQGRLEAAGRDHIIISDPKTGKRYLLLMVYLDYITFDEELNYTYPFGGSMLTTQAPRDEEED